MKCPKCKNIYDVYNAEEKAAGLYVCPDCKIDLNEDDIKPQPTKPENRGEASRNADYKAVYKATGDHRAAIRAYCAGNKWATENAKAVGNW